MNSLNNSVRLTGNVGNHPELKVLDSGTAVTKFSLYVNKSYKDKNTNEYVNKAQSFYLVAWGKKADYIAKYVTAGDRIAIEGELSSRSYENTKGEKVFLTEINVNEIENQSKFFKPTKETTSNATPKKTQKPVATKK